MKSLFKKFNEFETANNKFVLGDNILVAPLDKKETSRRVILPKGTWLSDDRITYKGGASYRIDVPITRLPLFKSEVGGKRNVNKAK